MADKNLILNQEYTSLPPNPAIDWSHPLTRGLTEVFIPAITTTSLIGKRVPTNIYNGKSNTTPKGRGITPNTSGLLYNSSGLFGGKTDVAWLIIAVQNDTSSGQSVVRHDGCLTMLQGLQIVSWAPSLVITGYSGVTQYTVNTYCGRGSNSEGTLLNWVNKGAKASTTFTVPLAAGKTTFCLGQSENNIEYATSFTIVAVYMWADKLSSIQQLNSLESNPFQIFKPQQKYISYSPKTPWSMRESELRGTDLVIPSAQIITTIYNKNNIKDASYVCDFESGVELVSGNPILFGTGGSSQTTASGISATASGTYLNRVVLPNTQATKIGTNDFTVFIRFTLNSTSGYLAIGKWKTGLEPINDEWCLGANSGFTTSELRFNVCVGTNSYAATTTGSWQAGHEYTFVGRRIGTTLIVNRFDHTDKIWITSSFTNAGITNINSNTSQNLTLGEVSIDQNLGANTTTSSVILFRRSISDTEVKSLSDNPWQIFKPDSKLIWGNK